MLAVALLAPQLGAMAVRAAVTAAAPDGSWSESRRAAYERLAGRANLPAPVGQLRLRDGSASVPVFSGTDEVALTLGAGHLPETGALDGAGNIAIAGHRDGFFRALRHVRQGDRMVLTSAAGPRTFEVTSTRIVAPDELSVLDPTPETVLTLITCHPFYFVGSAPDRFIVRARLVTESV